MTMQKQLEANRDNVKLSVKRDSPKDISNFFSNADNRILERQLLEEFSNLVNSKELTSSQNEREKELTKKLNFLYGLENGIWVGALSYEEYSIALMRMRQDIVKQYNCRDSLELMLADRIVANYWRSMRLDAILNRLTETGDRSYSFNDSKMNIMRELSKGLESASRQLNTSILFLKELKQPKMNIKVNTENAIIGQNQQFNVNKQNEQQQSEIIEPK